MDFDEFLREAARLLGLQWRRFRRRGIERKLKHRVLEIGLSTFEQYLFKVRDNPSELNHLFRILTVTISRFFRDQEVFNLIGETVIPTILENRNDLDLKVWSIGCASGEEPYSLSLLWKERFEKVCSKIRPSILATDIDEKLIQRAKAGRYRKSSLKEVASEIVRNSFEMNEGFYVLDKDVRETVDFRRHNIIQEDPFSEMDIVLCRNLAFTYFSKECQIDVLKKIATSLREEGYLVIGRDESLPFTYPTLFVPVFQHERIYQRFTPLESYSIRGRG
jgi:chemotaxis methyl-accepting protein methylase